MDAEEGQAQRGQACLARDVVEGGGVIELLAQHHRYRGAAPRIDGDALSAFGHHDRRRRCSTAAATAATATAQEGKSEGRGDEKVSHARKAAPA
jgi:hypothetical protein